jgi:hypothetical protein
MEMQTGVDFWTVHGGWFVFFLFFFPRLTLLFSSVVSGGFLWWLGWVLAPRLLTAILATYGFWNTNPVLVVLTWMWALGGESTEKGTASKSGKSSS